MGRFGTVLLAAAWLTTGCFGPPKVSVLKPESDRIHPGMQPEEVEAICGKPEMNITDPISGAAMWEYKDPKFGDHFTVMFNMDGVAKVRYGSS